LKLKIYNGFEDGNFLGENEKKEKLEKKVYCQHLYGQLSGNLVASENVGFVFFN
jgi:hypothetical protein